MHEGHLPISTAPLWRELVERLPAVVYVADFDARGTLRWISPRVEELLGIPADAFLDDDDLWYRCIHPDDVERVRAEEARVHAAVEPFDCEFRMVACDGRIVTVWERDALVRGEDGVPVCTQGVVVDVSSLRAAEARAEAESDRADGYLDLPGTIVVQVDRNGEIDVVNRALLDLLETSEEQLIGRRAEELLHPEAVHADAWAVLGSDGTEQVELPVRRGDGTRCDVVWTVTRLRDEHGASVGLLWAGVDITARRAAEERAAYLVRHDPLTGLPNRGLLLEHTELVLARSRRERSAAALLMLDLDDFKLVNESLGHAAGDRLLTQVAMRLSSRRRAQDVLARVGADEFAVLLTGLDPATADAAAETAARRYVSALEEPFDLEGTVFDLRASIGAALHPHDAVDAAALLRRAAAALHSAKSDGRGLVRRYRADRDEPRRPLSLGARLRAAIERHELVLHWQPIVDPHTTAVRGVEALVRWETGGTLLAPAAFVPFAEESGLIEQLDAHVLELACAEVAGWGGRAAELTFNVNVSPRALPAPGFAARVVDTLRAYRVAPERLVLEITESAAMVEAERSAPVLNELAAAGVQLAIDDFGAGYSSLARLLELPFDVLKIDRGFLLRASTNPGATAMIRAIVGLAGEIGVRPVVEGVETEEQLALVRELGCPQAQGYLLGAPVPGHELLSRLSGAGARVAV